MPAARHNMAIELEPSTCKTMGMGVVCEAEEESGEEMVVGSKERSHPTERGSNNDRRHTSTRWRARTVNVMHHIQSLISDFSLLRTVCYKEVVDPHTTKGVVTWS